MKNLNFSKVNPTQTFNIVTSIIIIFIAYKLLKFFNIIGNKGGANEEDTVSGSENALKGIDEDIKKFRDQGYTQTYANANYETYANTCFENMRYGFWENYDEVVKTCKLMMNNLDVALLFKAYGIRSTGVFMIPSQTADLFTTIRYELGHEYTIFGTTSEKMDEINQDWKAKGISYQI